MPAPFFFADRRLKTKIFLLAVVPFLAAIAGIGIGVRQQATQLAKLAELQLAFERQETPLAFIKSDYWERPASG